jgi:hypothetical protein
MNDKWVTPPPAQPFSCVAVDADAASASIRLSEVSGGRGLRRRPAAEAEVPKAGDPGLGTWGLGSVSRTGSLTPPPVARGCHACPFVPFYSALLADPTVRPRRLGLSCHTYPKALGSPFHLTP